MGGEIETKTHIYIQGLGERFMSSVPHWRTTFLSRPNHHTDAKGVHRKQEST